MLRSKNIEITGEENWRTSLRFSPGHFFIAWVFECKRSKKTCRKSKGKKQKVITPDAPVDSVHIIFSYKKNTHADTNIHNLRIFYCGKAFCQWLTFVFLGADLPILILLSNLQAEERAHHDEKRGCASSCDS